MKRLLIAIALLGMAGSAWAQAPAAQSSDDGDGTKLYAEVLGGGAFGNKTSGLFGAEVGIKVAPSIYVFGEVGRMLDVTASATETSAQAMAAWLGTRGYGVASSSVKTPVNFGAVGVRYVLAESAKFSPYAAASVGIANVEKQTTIVLNGTDVTSALPALGEQLGQDLSGKVNKAIITIGAGVQMPLGPVFVDVGARYGRIMTDPGINYFRVHGGVGIRF